MSRLSRKFVAVLLVIWLPLFSGNALAMTIPMQAMDDYSQTMDDHCLVAMQAQVGDPESGDQALSGHQPVPHQEPAEKNCGTCQLACCGYLVAVAPAIVETPPSAQSFFSAATQFQSYTSAPLDPPPVSVA